MEVMIDFPSVSSNDWLYAFKASRRY